MQAQVGSQGTPRRPVALVNGWPGNDPATLAYSWQKRRVASFQAAAVSSCTHSNGQWPVGDTIANDVGSTAHGRRSRQPLFDGGIMGAHDAHGSTDLPSAASLISSDTSRRSKGTGTTNSCMQHAQLDLGSRSSVESYAVQMHLASSLVEVPMMHHAIAPKQQQQQHQAHLAAAMAILSTTPPAAHAAATPMASPCKHVLSSNIVASPRRLAANTCVVQARPAHMLAQWPISVELDDQLYGPAVLVQPPLLDSDHGWLQPAQRSQLHCAAATPAAVPAAYPVFAAATTVLSASNARSNGITTPVCAEMQLSDARDGGSGHGRSQSSSSGSSSSCGSHGDGSNGRSSHSGATSTEVSAPPPGTTSKTASRSVIAERRSNNSGGRRGGGAGAALTVALKACRNWYELQALFLTFSPHDVNSIHLAAALTTLLRMQRYTMSEHEASAFSAFVRRLLESTAATALPEASPTELSIIMHALGSLSVCPTPPWLKRYAAVAALQLHIFGPKELALTAWGLGKCCNVVATDLSDSTSKPTVAAVANVGGGGSSRVGNESSVRAGHSSSQPRVHGIDAADSRISSTAAALQPLLPVLFLAIEQRLEQLNPQDLANVAVGLPKLAPLLVPARPPTPVSADPDSRAMDMLDILGPQNRQQQGSSLASTSLQYPAATPEAAAAPEQSLPPIPGARSSPQLDLTRFWLRFADAALPQLGTCNSQALSNIIHALAEVHCNLSYNWLSRYCDVCYSQLGSYSPQSLATILGALQRLGHDPGLAWITRFLQRSAACLHVATSEDLAHTGAAVAAVCSSTVAFTSAAAGAPLPAQRLQFSLFSASAVDASVDSTAAGAGTGLGRRQLKSRRLRTEDGADHGRRPTQNSSAPMRQGAPTTADPESDSGGGVPIQFSSAGEAAAATALRHWLEVYEETLQQRLKVLPPTPLVRCLVALARLHHQPAGATRIAWLAASLPRLPAFNPTDLAQALWAVARLNFAPDPAWMAAAVAASRSCLHEATLADLALQTWSMGHQRYRPSWQWLKDFDSVSCSRLGSMGMQDLAVTLHGAVQLQWRPSLGWVSAAMAAVVARLQCEQQIHRRWGDEQQPRIVEHDNMDAGYARLGRNSSSSIRNNGFDVVSDIGSVRSDSRSAAGHSTAIALRALHRLQARPSPDQLQPLLRSLHPCLPCYSLRHLAMVGVVLSKWLPPLATVSVAPWRSKASSPTALRWRLLRAEHLQQSTKQASQSVATAASRVLPEADVEARDAADRVRPASVHTHAAVGQLQPAGQQPLLLQQQVAGLHEAARVDELRLVAVKPSRLRLQLEPKPPQRLAPAPVSALTATTDATCAPLPALPSAAGTAAAGLSALAHGAAAHAAAIVTAARKERAEVRRRLFTMLLKCSLPQLRVGDDVSVLALLSALRTLHPGCKQQLHAKSNLGNDPSESVQGWGGAHSLASKPHDVTVPRCNSDSNDGRGNLVHLQDSDKHHSAASNSNSGSSSGSNFMADGPNPATSTQSPLGSPHFADPHLLQSWLTQVYDVLLPVLPQLNPVQLVSTAHSLRIIHSTPSLPSPPLSWLSSLFDSALKLVTEQPLSVTRLTSLLYSCSRLTTSAGSTPLSMPSGSNHLPACSQSLAVAVVSKVAAATEARRRAMQAAVAASTAGREAAALAQRRRLQRERVAGAVGTLHKAMKTGQPLMPKGVQQVLAAAEARAGVLQAGGPVARIRSAHGKVRRSSRAWRPVRRAIPPHPWLVMRRKQKRADAASTSSSSSSSKTRRSAYAAQAELRQKGGLQLQQLWAVQRPQQQQRRQWQSRWMLRPRWSVESSEPLSATHILQLAEAVECLQARLPTTVFHWLRRECRRVKAAQRRGVQRSGLGKQGGVVGAATSSL